MFDTSEIAAIRDRFAHVDACPFTGPRIFFENAGGALTLKSVVETSSRFAAIPDNQGRDNPASHALVDIIEKGRRDAARFLGATGGQIVLGESGTELLFRIIAAACAGARDGMVLGSTLEHPATRSAAARWAEETGMAHVLVPHDNETGTISPDAYAAAVTPQTRVATIIHTSPVTGMGVDIAAVSDAIRAIAPDCRIIVDGIQHAAHGGISTEGVDAYIVSPYKVFSRHGYGVAWLSDAMANAPHDTLIGGPGSWELGTRDTGAYATFSDVTGYFDWLDEITGNAPAAIKAHEAGLVGAMLHGTDNRPGLLAIDGVNVLFGADNPAREGLLALTLDKMPAAEAVTALNERGIRTHTRKADHYSGNVLTPLGLDACIRVSLCHYNTLDEASAFLAAMREIA